MQQHKGRIMAKLTADKRNALPKSAFAGPDRSFPVNNASHAANAKARATQAVNAGRMSPSEKAKIDAKANAVLGHGGDRKGPQYHMNKASQHIQKALEKRLGAKD